MSQSGSVVQSVFTLDLIEKLTSGSESEPQPELEITPIPVNAVQIQIRSSYFDAGRDQDLISTSRSKL